MIIDINNIDGLDKIEPHEGGLKIGALVRNADLAADPQVRRAYPVLSRALLAGCRGEVPLGMLIELLAATHGVDDAALADAALPVVREAIGRGILYQAN